ncbi:hypothetical protein SAMN05216266_107297 [Amycolatopsis marina]|uniref:NUDIX domain-containing protein n=1 Tax=Amycolatopsis marina TaxID=490629 RepID=A0A1I0ZVU2_9PSEU|nr:hypothetical protein SAMN05216266_107297 [Amycolatopsis marina]
MREVREEFSICFRVKPLGGETRTSSESKKVHWVGVDFLPSLGIHTSIRLRVEHALQNRPLPYYA